MTYKAISKTTCDACGKTDGSVETQQYSSHLPARWATIDIEWQDREDKYHDESYHLCPPCSVELIEAILKKELKSHERE
jgi:hypothetical protein